MGTPPGMGGYRNCGGKRGATGGNRDGPACDGPTSRIALGGGMLSCLPGCTRALLDGCDLLETDAGRLVVGRGNSARGGERDGLAFPPTPACRRRRSWPSSLLFRFLWPAPVAGTAVGACDPSGTGAEKGGGGTLDRAPRDFAEPRVSLERAALASARSGHARPSSSCCTSDISPVSMLFKIARSSSVTGATVGLSSLAA